MLFQDLRVQDIHTVFRFSSRAKRFASGKRQTHILGIHLSGRALHRFDDGRTEMLEQGQLYYFNPKDSYRVEIIEPGIAFSVHFTTVAPVFQDSFFARVDDTSEVIACLERLEKSFLFGGCCPETLSELYRLLSLFGSFVQSPEPEQNWRMERAREYLRLHVREKGCIAQAAGKYGVTPRRFTDLFSQQYSMTPNRYLLQVKLEQAKQLLPVQEFSLAQVAELSGFSDVYYFSKVFKKEIGQTPGTYRERWL